MPGWAIHDSLLTLGKCCCASYGLLVTSFEFIGMTIRVLQYDCHSEN